MTQPAPRASGSVDAHAAYKAGVHDGYWDRPFSRLYRQRTPSHEAYSEGRSDGKQQRSQGKILRVRVPDKWRFNAW